MSISGNLQNPALVSKVAKVDLTNYSYQAVVQDNTGGIIVPTFATEQPFGIVQEGGVTNQAVQVAPINGGGRSRIVLSATLATGAAISIDATGQAAAAASGQYTIGQLEQGGAKGETGVVSLGFITITA